MIPETQAFHYLNTLGLFPVFRILRRLFGTLCVIVVISNFSVKKLTSRVITLLENPWLCVSSQWKRRSAICAIDVPRVEIFMKYSFFPSARENDSLVWVREVLAWSDFSYWKGSEKHCRGSAMICTGDGMKNKTRFCLQYYYSKK